MEILNLPYDCIRYHITPCLPHLYGNLNRDLALDIKHITAAVLKKMGSYAIKFCRNLHVNILGLMKENLINYKIPVKMLLNEKLSNIIFWIRINYDIGTPYQIKTDEDHYKDFNTRSNNYELINIYPIQLVCMYGWTSLLKYMLKDTSIKHIQTKYVKSIDSKHKNLMYCVIKSISMDCTKRRRTIFNQVECFRLILQANPELSIQDYQHCMGTTLLHEAVKSEQIDVIAYLLEKCAMDVDILEEGKTQTPLLFYLHHGGNSSKISNEIEKDDNIKQTTVYKIIQLLLDNGACVQTRNTNKNNENVLYYLLKNQEFVNQTELVYALCKKFIKHGACLTNIATYTGHHKYKFLGKSNGNKDNFITIYNPLHGDNMHFLYMLEKRSMKFTSRLRNVIDYNNRDINYMIIKNTNINNHQNHHDNMTMRFRTWLDRYYGDKMDHGMKSEPNINAIE
jgi:hypothetical protein